MTQLPLISCLCVTEDRPRFLPWMIWNYTKQTYDNCELIVIDSSADRDPLVAAIQDANAKQVTVEYVQPGTLIGAKRNRAIESCNGDYIVWHDDDDWYHPQRLDWLAAMLVQGQSCVGWNRGWFVDVDTLLCRDTYKSYGVYASTACVHRDLALSIPFAAQAPAAEDTEWMRKIHAKQPDPFVMPRELISMLWIQHGSNVCERRNEHYIVPLQELADVVSKQFWADTDKRIAATFHSG